MIRYPFRYCERDNKKTYTEIKKNKKTYVKSNPESSTELINASFYAHLLDQLEWGLLEKEEVWQAARELLVFSDLEKSKRRGKSGKNYRKR